MQGALPVEIAKKLDYSSLQADPNSYVDQQLQDFYSDVVYTCSYGAGAQLHLTLLFEHKSYVPQRPHLQLLRYMLNIWEQRVKESLPLHPIIPLIVYHGKDAWKAKELSDYFEGEIDEALNPFIPSFNYLLTNLRDESHDSIRQRFQLLTLQMGFLLMKSFRDPALLTKLEDILQGIDELLTHENGRVFLEQIVVYLYNSTTLDDQEIMNEFKNIT